MANPDNERTSEIDGIETRQAKTLQSESQQQGTQGNNDINNGGDMEKYLNEGPSPEDIGRGWGEINTNQEERKSIFKQYREFKKINKRYIKKLNEFSNEVLNIKGDSIDSDVMSILSPIAMKDDFDKIFKDNIKSIIKDIKEQPFFNMNDIKNIVLRKSKERDRFGSEYIRARTIAQAIAAYDSNKAMANIINNEDIFSNLTDEELNVINYAKANRGLYEFDLMDAIYNYSLDKNKHFKAVHNLRERIEKKPGYNSENNQGEITFFSKAQIKELMSKSQISDSYGPSTSNVPIEEIRIASNESHIASSVYYNNLIKICNPGVKLQDDLKIYNNQNNVSPIQTNPYLPKSFNPISIMEKKNNNAFKNIPNIKR